MAGTADILHRAYTGITVRNDVLWFNPVLPEDVGRLHMHIRYRGHALEIDITRNIFQIRALMGADGPVRIGLRDQIFDLKMGDTRKFDLER
jgi:alpha,alpha-trehalase